MRCFNRVYLLCALLLFLPGCFGEVQKDRLFQYSTIDALMKGKYDGDMTFGELKQYGNFGMGTVNGLDGEMISVEGKFYRAGYDGKVSLIGDAQKTPFAETVFFSSDQVILLGQRTDMKQFVIELDKMIKDKDLFYAIRVEGEFENMKVRSVPKQEKPYPGLADAVKKQAVFEKSKVYGTIVGFRCPQYVGGSNVAGYHFHFISRDRTYGGHVLDFTLEEAAIDVDIKKDIKLVLP